MNVKLKIKIKSVLFISLFTLFHSIISHNRNDIFQCLHLLCSLAWQDKKALALLIFPCGPVAKIPHSSVQETWVICGSPGAAIRQ